MINEHNAQHSVNASFLINYVILLIFCRKFPLGTDEVPKTSGPGSEFKKSSDLYSLPPHFPIYLILF